MERTAARGGCRPLLYLRFAFIWSRKCDFYQGKVVESHGGQKVPLYMPYRYVLPQSVYFFSCFGLKIGHSF